ncbi:phage holin family protein [Povalibacter sp.]|uniref:phage holin family protein n=1 Tax=Povalibacter sp. TaxID=1962978 RepID=UPI002F424A94
MHDSSQDRDPAPVTGLFQSLNNFVATLVAITHTRLQLLTTEIQEEVQEVAKLLIWSFIALFAAMMALFLGALTIIFAFWDTHRITAAIVMTGAFLLIAAIGGIMLMRRLKAKPPMLDATLAELAKDRDQLRARM